MTLAHPLEVLQDMQNSQAVAFAEEGSTLSEEGPQDTWLGATAAADTFVMHMGFGVVWGPSSGRYMDVDTSEPSAVAEQHKCDQGEVGKKLLSQSKWKWPVNCWLRERHSSHVPQSHPIDQLGERRM